MDWNLSSGGTVVYRVSQGIAVLIIGLRFLLTPIPPDSPVLLPFALTLAAIFLLAFVVRILAGNYGGAISQLVLSWHAGFVAFSPDRTLALFCLSAAVALLATRDYTTDRTHNAALCLALAVPVALTWRMRLCFVPLWAAVAFSYLLLRYVPPDSVRPFRTLLRALRANRSCAQWEFLIMTAAGLLSAIPLLLSGTTRIHSAFHSAMADPAGYSVAVARLFVQFLGTGEDLDTLPARLVPPLLIASAVTLWWLFVSVQSGSGLPFSLTAIPVAYLVSGALSLRAGYSYAHAVYPILLANLIAFLGLWWRGRANKRVLDSTPD